MNKEIDKCSNPDWEAMYNNLLVENEALHCKYDALTEEMNKLKKECSYLEEWRNEIEREKDEALAKLEMVYLIFGGRR